MVNVSPLSRSDHASNNVWPALARMLIKLTSLIMSEVDPYGVLIINEYVETAGPTGRRRGNVPS